MKPTRDLVKTNKGLWNVKGKVWYQKNDDYDIDEEIKQVKLRKRRIGTFEEQQEARRKHNSQMRRMNKEARDMGFARGIDQVGEENK